MSERRFVIFITFFKWSICDTIVIFVFISFVISDISCAYKSRSQTFVFQRTFISVITITPALSIIRVKYMFFVRSCNRPQIREATVAKFHLILIKYGVHRVGWWKMLLK